MIPVEGHKNLFRDEKTGAIINMDTRDIIIICLIKDEIMINRQKQML